MGRDIDRKKAKRYRQILTYVSNFDIPDIVIIKRVLKNGPEIVGGELLTREQAYFMLWQKIFFSQMPKRNFKPGQTSGQDHFDYSPKPIPSEHNPEKTGKKYNPLEVDNA